MGEARGEKGESVWCRDLHCTAGNDGVKGKRRRQRVREREREREIAEEEGTRRKRMKEMKEGTFFFFLFSFRLKSRPPVSRLGGRGAWNCGREKCSHLICLCQSVCLSVWTLDSSGLWAGGSGRLRLYFPFRSVHPGQERKEEKTG